MERWIGKVAVVTGASSGIGRSIAKSLTTVGMNVFGLAKRENRLKELSNDLKDTKGSFQYSICDVRNEEEILKAFENVEKQFDGIDVLVNNAGVAAYDTIGKAKTESFRSILEVNVLAAAICTREAMKSMRKQKTEGHIININSVLGMNANIQQNNVCLYPSSKFALHAMTDTLKNEIIVNKDNIRVTGIYPGLVKTEIFRHSHELGVFDHFPYLKSEEIADCVIFALSASPKTQVTQIVITPLHEKL